MGEVQHYTSRDGSFRFEREGNTWTMRCGSFGSERLYKEVTLLFKDAASSARVNALEDLNRDYRTSREYKQVAEKLEVLGQTLQTIFAPSPEVTDQSTKVIQLNIWDKALGASEDKIELFLVNQEDEECDPIELDQKNQIKIAHLCYEIYGRCLGRPIEEKVSYQRVNSVEKFMSLPIYPKIYEKYREIQEPLFDAEFETFVPVAVNAIKLSPEELNNLETMEEIYREVRQRIWKVNFNSNESYQKIKEKLKTENSLSPALADPSELTEKQTDLAVKKKMLADAARIAVLERMLCEKGQESETR